MTSFVDRLRAHLEGLDRPAARVPIDLARIRAHVVRRLDETASVDPGRGARLLLNWPHDRRDSFVLALASRLTGGMAPDARPDELMSLLEAGVDLQMALDVPGLGSVREAELRHHAWRAWRDSEGVAADIDRYAFETRLVRALDERRSTRAGRVWLATPGEDAIRLLLSLEVAQSLGREDRYRMSREGIRYLVQNVTGVLWETRDDDAPWPMPLPALSRAAGLGLLVLDEDDTGCFYRHSLTSLGTRLLGEIAGGEETQWTLLAATLVAEERGASIAELVPQLARAQDRQLHELSAREARLVAHEVRNALAPVRVQLDRLYRALSREAADFDVDRFRPGIDRGLVLAFDFVEARLQIAAVMEQGAEVFPLDDALREAVRHGGAAIELVEGAAGAAVRGPRHDFVIVVVELLRNALASEPTKAVSARICSSRRNGRALVAVDDDGPGLSLEAARHAFERGFSTKGGSGQGLALAKEVVEAAMSGTIRLSASDLGGCRVEIDLPLALPEGDKR